jgi:hypothetical protein
VTKVIIVKEVIEATKVQPAEVTRMLVEVILLVDERTEEKETLTVIQVIEVIVVIIERSHRTEQYILSLT